MLGDYAGVAICDGYKVYDVLAREREGSDLTLAHYRVAGGGCPPPAPTPPDVPVGIQVVGPPFVV